MARVYKNSKKESVPKVIFRAYDIRGKYPSEVNEKVVFKVAQSLSDYFNSKTKKKASKIVIGRDGRVGSPSLYRTIISGLKSGRSRVKIIKIGIATTPMFYILVSILKADGGIMVTASHNPKEYNGLKIVGKNAEMISGKEVLKILSKGL